MRRLLLLLRHAKAERSQPGGSDRERVLTDRGRSDARKVGAYLLRHGLVPRCALVSPTARTRETWKLVRKTLNRTLPVQLEERLYNATPDDIMAVIRQTATDIETLMVIGHNPGLHAAAVMLVASGDIEARQRLNEHFPTSALALIEFAITDWSRLRTKGGRLEHFVTPRSLEAATD
jgi:phosphohistidine phosphatase